MNRQRIRSIDDTPLERVISSARSVVPATKHEVVVHHPPEQVIPERTMTIQYVRPELASFLNGRIGRRPFEKTREHFHRSAYAWLLPLDVYRWSIDGHTGDDTVCRTVLRAGRRFGLLLHTRGNRRLTMTGLQAIERADRLEKNTFHARAARFNEMFGDLPQELRPFFYYEFDDIRGQSEPAYQMHTGREYIVVVGPTDGTPLDAVDWEYFLTPPGAPGQPHQQ